MRSAASSGCMILMATFLSSAVWRARYTVPIDPLPRRASILNLPAIARPIIGSKGSDASSGLSLAKNASMPAAGADGDAVCDRQKHTAPQEIARWLAPRQEAQRQDLRQERQDRPRAEERYQRLQVCDAIRPFRGREVTGRAAQKTVATCPPESAHRPD